jgi:hypothetical protein
MFKLLLGTILSGSAIAQSGNGRISGLVLLCADSPPADEQVCTPLLNVGVSLRPAGSDEISGSKGVERDRWSSGGPAEEGHPNRTECAGCPAVPKSSVFGTGESTS